MIKHINLIALLLFASSIAAQNITVNNRTSQSKKRGYYDWTVFIQADEATLNTIDHVEYLLPPTFITPQVSSYNRKTNFGYSATGWGEFEIKAKVVFKDRSKPGIYITYWLRLQSKVLKKVVKYNPKT
jgi:transcription initiation factor IIF auxiliary subunit